MKPRNYLKSILVLCLLPVLLLNASVTHAAPLSCGGWSVVNSPNPGTPDGLGSVAAVSASDVWAVGSEGSQMGRGQTVIEHWNGTQWSVVKSPNPGFYNTLYSVAVVSASDVWAVGFQGNRGVAQTLIEQWNGTQWSVVKSPSPPDSIGSELFGVDAISASDIWAVGFIAYNTAIGPVQNTLIEHWNGTSWSVVPNPNPGSSPVLDAVAAVSATDVWAVGNTSNQTLIEQWNGKQWSVVKSPNPGSGGELRSVAAVSASDVWTVGDYINGSAGQTLAEHWNGTSWSVVKSPSPGSTGNLLLGVAVVSSSDIWTVGSYPNSNQVDQSLTERWNGTQWSVVKSPSPGSTGTQLKGVAAISPGDVWAVGYADSKTLIEHYC